LLESKNQKNAEERTNLGTLYDWRGGGEQEAPARGFRWGQEGKTVEKMGEPSVGWKGGGNSYNQADNLKKRMGGKRHGKGGKANREVTLM